MHTSTAKDICSNAVSHAKATLRRWILDMGSAAKGPSKGGTGVRRLSSKHAHLKKTKNKEDVAEADSEAEKVAETNQNL